MQVVGGQLNKFERFEHDCFLASVATYPGAVALAYFASGGMTAAISTLVTYFAVFEAIGVAIGAGASIYFRNSENLF